MSYRPVNMGDEDFEMVRGPVKAAQPLMAVQPAQPAKPTHAPQSTGAAKPQKAASRSHVWYMWRGQLHVGAMDVGPATVWSEYVTFIPALSEILKMTRIAKYEDLWHKVLQSQPCQLSQKNAVTISGRTVTVHGLSSHSKAFHQLIEELSETSKPQILTCQLLNEKNYVEVVLMPHCPELEQCGLQGYRKPMLHVVFVCRRSNTCITSLHKLLDVVDLSEACMTDLCTPTKNTEDKVLEVGLECCEESDIPEVKGSASEVCSCYSKVSNLTANTEKLAEKRECPILHGAAPSLNDGNVMEMSDNRHVGLSFKNALVDFDADQCISARTKKLLKQGEGRSLAMEGYIELLESKAPNACGSMAEVQLMDDPAHQTEIRLSENGDSERNGLSESNDSERNGLSESSDSEKNEVEYSTDDDGVEIDGHSEDHKVKERGRTTDVEDDNSKTLQNSEENTEETKELETSKKSKKSSKWNIHRFIKTLKPVGNKKDYPDKRKCRKHSSKWLKGSEVHLPKTEVLDNVLLNDKKLRKVTKVVVKKQSLEMMLHEAKERLGIHIKAPKMQRINKNSMLDTKKLKDLFSLKDSSKPDLIKPSMLKRNYEECVIVNPLSMEDDQTSEPKTCVTPDILRCLEINSENKRKETSTNELNNNPATSGYLVEDSSESEIVNCITKRQKTANGENCSLLKQKKNIGYSIMCKEKIRECVKNSPKRISGNTADSLPENHKNINVPNSALDLCPSSEQSQELKEGKPNLSHTVAQNGTMQQNYKEHNFESERKLSKKKMLKRKLECEWTEAMDDFHPRKRCCWIKECLADFGIQTKESSSIMDNSRLVFPAAYEILRGKLENEGINSRSEDANVNEEIQIPGCDEDQDKIKQQQQVSKEENIPSLEHSESSLSEPHKTSSLSEPEDRVQRNGLEESHNKFTHDHDYNHNFYSHESDHSESGSIKDTLKLDTSEKYHTVEAEGCNPARERQPDCQSSAPQGSQYKSPPQGLDPMQSQSFLPQTNLTDAAVPSLVSLKEVAYESGKDIIEAQSSSKQRLPAGSKNITGTLCGEGIPAEHSKAEVRKDPVDLHHESSKCMKKCDKTQEESQKSATDSDLTSVHSALNQASSKKSSSSLDQLCVPHSEQGSAGDSCISVSVTNFLQTPRDDLQNDECKDSRRNGFPKSVLTEMSKSSVTDLPCPKVMAKSVQSNMKYYMLRVHSPLSVGLEGLNKKHECLPVLQASVDTFHEMSQNTSQQSDHSGSRKSLLSERKLPGIKKILLETVLKKMKLQLLRDANMLSNVGQCPVSSGLKTLASFIEGQMDSPPQGRSVSQALHKTVVKDVLENHHILPELGKSLITQKVAELHHPYKMSSVQPLYVANCRTPVDSGLCTSNIPQNPREQELSTDSLLAAGFPLKDSKQQHYLPTSLKKCLSQESSCPSAIYSISAQPGHNTKTLGAIERAVFVPNELYQPLWKDFPFQAPLEWKQDSKYIHLFQGKQQEVIKLKCLLVARKKCYGTLKDIEFYGGHVLAHHTVLDQLLASLNLSQLCAFSRVSFGVYGTLAHVLEGQVAVVLAEERLLLLVHHTALLDPKTGDVLQAVSSNGLHLVLIPAHTLHTCTYLLCRQPRTAAEKKLKEVLQENLKYVMKCVEAGAGRILGGSRGSACATLSPEAPITEYLTCLRVIHRCLNFTHRYTAVLIGEGVKETAKCHLPSVHQLCAAKEVLQHFLKVSHHERK